MKLMRWLPQIARASDGDKWLYGSQAARVRSLLDFLPTMSEDAVRLSGDVRYVPKFYNQTAHLDAYDAAYDAERGNAAWNATQDAWDIMGDRATKLGIESGASDAAFDAALGEVVNDFIRPDVYRDLTSPLAVGRAFDVLRPRSPENFLSVVRGLGEWDAIQQPSDLLLARRFGASPEEVRDITLGLIADGKSLDEALQIARTMAR